MKIFQSRYSTAVILTENDIEKNRGKGSLHELQGYRLDHVMLPMNYKKDVKLLRNELTEGNSAISFLLANMKVGNLINHVIFAYY